MDGKAEEFLWLSIQLGKVVTKVTQKSIEETTTTFLQYCALDYLKQYPKCAIGDLSSHIKLSYSSTSQLIERLEKVGAVKRIQDEKDKELCVWILQEKGKNT